MFNRIYWSPSMTSGHNCRCCDCNHQYDSSVMKKTTFQIKIMFQFLHFRLQWNIIWVFLIKNNKIFNRVITIAIALKLICKLLFFRNSWKIDSQFNLPLSLKQMKNLYIQIETFSVFLSPQFAVEEITVSKWHFSQP